MPKNAHEIRDPIHVFVRLDSDERKVVDSQPFQRLRHIHQLALSYLVYPGATHRRFEHSLGVMELATRIFDVVTRRDSATDEVRRLLPQLSSEVGLAYWRRVLRVAALCHDMGHMPFSHAAEKRLLPEGWSHERLSRELITSPEMTAVWKKMEPPPDSEHIVKLALGPKEAPDLAFSPWEAILADIITGDAFGADRMDYLLRDSHHTGVAYGRFDHHRLIDTLRILPGPPAGEGDFDNEPVLGVEHGGIQSAEALLLARYFMFSQVYFHPVRRIYDIHLEDFLAAHLGKYPTALDEHLRLTDNEMTAAIHEAARDSAHAGHAPARRIVGRGHFRELYRRNPDDMKVNRNAAAAVCAAARGRFGDENVRFDSLPAKGKVFDFPVLAPDGRIISSLSASETLAKIPNATFEFVFVSPEKRTEASKWLDSDRAAIIRAE